MTLAEAIEAYEQKKTLVAPDGTTYKREPNACSSHTAYLITYEDCAGLIPNGHYSQLRHTDSPPFGEDWKILEN